MTLDELAGLLFSAPAGFPVDKVGTFHGAATLKNGREVFVAGIANGTPVSPEVALTLAGYVLEHAAAGKQTPLVLLIDTASQNMARRDEMLGLNEYLSHLAKSLVLSAKAGIRVVSVLYGKAAAGAFIASALSAQTLASVPGAEPSVMDLPSIARVTKLSLDQLQDMSKTTPIFAPGIDYMVLTGAVAENWKDKATFADRLAKLIEAPAPASDDRVVLGKERGGRKVAGDIAKRVVHEAESLA